MRSTIAALCLCLAACSQSPSTTDAATDAPSDAPLPDAADLCTSTCSAVQECCETALGLSCVDVYTSPMNCGACGVTCSGWCVDGVCQ